MGAARAPTKQCIPRAEISTNLEHFWVSFGLPMAWLRICRPTLQKRIRRAQKCGHLWHFWGPDSLGLGRGCSPPFLGPAKDGQRPRRQAVFAAYLGQQSKLFLRSVKGTAHKRGLDCGRPVRLSGPFLEVAIGGGWLLLFGSGVAACRGPCVLPFGRPALGLLWDCSGVPWACSGLLWLLWGCSKLPWERLDN